MNTNILQHEMRSARDLIRDKRYDEARIILSRLRHPLAQKWLAKLNEIAPSAEKPSMSWPKMCIRAIFRPTRKTFEAIIADPRASALRASWWIFFSTVAGLVLGTVMSLWWYPSTWRGGLLESAGLLVEALPVSLVAGVASLALFWIGIIIVQTVGRLLGGKGTYGKLAYAVATFTSLAQLVLLPLTIPILFLLLMLVYIIPWPILAFLMLLGFLYFLFVPIVAVAAVNHFGWIKAAAAALAPLLLIAALNVATIRFYIDGSSMQPTLQTGDYILVSRINYLWGDPARGDLVIFHTPFNGDDVPPSINRVIGLPSERVELRDTRVYVNGIELVEVYLKEPCSPTRCHDQIWDLGPDEYFVMGDNRNSSRDSRVFGPVSRDRLMGEAVLRYWPWSAWGLLY